MYLPTEYEVITNGIDKKNTPQYIGGHLTPEKDFHMEPLLSAAPGTIYASQETEIQNCKRAVTNTCLWVKKKRTGGGPCGSAGACDDWVKLGGSNLFCGTLPPTGSAEFNCKQLGSVYLQTVSGANASPMANGCGCGTSRSCKCGTMSVHVWMKVADDCAAEDWLLVSPNIIVPDVMGVLPYSDECDQNTIDYLNGLPVGSRVLVMGVGGCVAADYIKMSDVCAGIKDWTNVKAACVLKGEGNPNEMMAEEGESDPDCLVLGDVRIKDKVMA